MITMGRFFCSQQSVPLLARQTCKISKICSKICKICSKICKICYFEHIGQWFLQKFAYLCTHI